MVVSQSPLFRAFGPGMALAVLMTVAVSVTLVPALLAIIGRFALWPSAQRRGRAAAAATPSRSPPTQRDLTALEKAD